MCLGQMACPIVASEEVIAIRIDDLYICSKLGDETSSFLGVTCSRYEIYWETW